MSKRLQKTPALLRVALGAASIVLALGLAACREIGVSLAEQDAQIEIGAQTTFLLGGVEVPEPSDAQGYTAYVYDPTSGNRSESPIGPNGSALFGNLGVGFTLTAGIEDVPAYCSTRYFDRWQFETRHDKKDFSWLFELTCDLPPASLSDNFSPDCTRWQANASINGTGTATESCPASGGSDGSGYREMRHELSGLGNLVVDHAFSDSLQVGPQASGATCGVTVRFRERRRVVTAAFSGAAVGAGVWIIQNGTRYRATSPAFTDTQWSAFDSGDLTASAFTPSGLDLCPASPTSLRFGYSRSNTNTSSGSQVMVHGIDQWQVVITP